MSSIELRNKIIWFLVLILIPFFSYAELTSDNFDSYSTGYINLVSGGNWKSYNNTNSLRVISGSPFSADNYLGYGNISAWNKEDIDIYSDIWVKFKLKISSASEGYLFFPVLNQNTSGQAVSNQISLVWLWKGSDNKIKILARTTCLSAKEFIDTGVTYTADMDITIYYNIVNRTYRLFINEYTSADLPLLSDIQDCVPSNFNPRLVGFSDFANTNIKIDDFSIHWTNPFNADGVCGADNGQQLNSIPVNLCSVGEATTVLSNPTGWTWECLPVNLGLIDYCSAIRGENAIAGVCGADNGQILSNPPVNFCNAGLLVLGSYSENPEGYSWQCSGTFSEIVENCSATKGTIFFPEPPDTEDCSGLSVLEGLVCEVKNLIASAFTPSSDAINRLNQSLYNIKNKAPFNYLYGFLNQVENISITETESTNFCIMGHCGNIEIMNTLAENTKISFTFLFSLGFIFYLLNYIKRFFL